MRGSINLRSYSYVISVHPIIFMCQHLHSPLILPSFHSFLRFITTSFLILPIIYHLHLLSITGPYSVNGVPLRRVNQRYVIATNTSVSLAGVNVSAIEDDFFAREKVTKKVTTYPIYIPWYITSKNNHQRNPQIVGT